MRLEPLNSWWKSNLSQQKAEKKAGEKEGAGKHGDVELISDREYVT